MQRPNSHWKAAAEKASFLIPLFLLFSLGLLLYGVVLRAPFFFDDYPQIVNNSALKDMASLGRIWKIEYVKINFLTYVTFALNYRWGGMNPFGFHLVNVLLHVLSSFLCYRLVQRFFSCPALFTSPLRERKRSFALIAALIFLCHPLQTQAVSYIWSRSEILSALFCFSAMLLYLNGRLKRIPSLIFLAYVLFFAGIFARGNLIVFPILVLLTEISFLGPASSRSAPGSSSKWLLIAFLALGAIPSSALFPKLLHFLSVHDLVKDNPASRIDYLLTQFSVIVQYLKLCIVPLGQNLDYDLPIAHTLWDPRTFCSLIPLLSLLALAGLLFKRQRLVAFGIFWFFVCLLPVSSIFPLTTVISESRLYLPLFGFSLVLTTLLFTWITERKAVVRVAFVLITVLSFLTVARNIVWRSPIALMEDAVKKSPLNGRANANLGLAYSSAGLYDKAFLSFRRAFVLGDQRGMDKESLAQILINISALYGIKGDFNEAIYYCRQAIDYNPRNPQAYSNLGYAYSVLGDSEQAVLYGRKALEISPDFIEGLINLGITYGRMEKYPEAIEKFERALALEHGNLQAQENLLLARRLLQASKHP